MANACVCYSAGSGGRSLQSGGIETARSKLRQLPKEARRFTFPNSWEKVVVYFLEHPYQQVIQGSSTWTNFKTLPPVGLAEIIQSLQSPNRMKNSLNGSKPYLDHMLGHGCLIQLIDSLRKMNH